MNSEDEHGADTSAAPGPEGAGAMLREARLDRRLDLAHIAAETRIPIRHLEAIEAGDYAALPSRTYAIGFSRTYARVVGLDEHRVADAVRTELADGEGRRSAMGGGMEPGDPAKLPSRGLAWFGAFAALVLAVGLISFFNSWFGAGTTPPPLVSEAEPAPDAAPVPAATPRAAAAASAAGGPVVFTALEDGVWARFYEEGGDRLLEKQLAKGESFEVPVDASDPRINTGRPDLLAITVGGKSVPKLSDEPVTIGGEPVSAAALLARNSATPVPGSQRPASAVRSGRVPARRPPESAPAPETPEPSETDAPPAAEPTAASEDAAAASGSRAD